MKTLLLVSVVFTSLVTFAERQGPWTREKAWEWYNAQPWIRGCNFMPSTAANHFDTWQSYDAENRFAVVERELALAEETGFNTIRLIISAEWGFAAWLQEHDAFMANFERMLTIAHRHGIRAIPVLGNDCSRPKDLWQLPKPGPQQYDIGYHGARKVSQHGSRPNEVGFTALDDPELRPKFFEMCEELLTKYRNDERILLWNIWNEPGCNRRAKLTLKDMKELFELAWKIDPAQPLTADVFNRRYGCADEPMNEYDRLLNMAAEFSDIVSFHCYMPLYFQKDVVEKLEKRYQRPMVNTEWLARCADCMVADNYAYFAQKRIGCTCWGLVAGKYQTYEPSEGEWADVLAGRIDHHLERWLHDLYRINLRPYDPKEIAIIKRINRQMDAERLGDSLRSRIAKSHKIIKEDMWYGYRRVQFDFNGRTAAVIEPTGEPAKGTPWTWTIQWWDAFVDRTGALDLLSRGWHHVWIDVFAERGSAKALAEFAAFQEFLVKELGFAPKANLIGMSWGGFFSTRYAAAYPENVARIYLDAPLLNLDALSSSAGSIGPWTNQRPVDGWTNCPEMPLNKAEALAAAKIPLLLLYGGQDLTVLPDKSCEPFAERFKAAGGDIVINRRSAFGHHPHGLDPNKTEQIVTFFLKGVEIK